MDEVFSACEDEFNFTGHTLFGFTISASLIVTVDEHDWRMLFVDFGNLLRKPIGGHVSDNEDTDFFDNTFSPSLRGVVCKGRDKSFWESDASSDNRSSLFVVPSFKCWALLMFFVGFILDGWPKTEFS